MVDLQTYKDNPTKKRERFIYWQYKYIRELYHLAQGYSDSVFYKLHLCNSYFCQQSLC